MLLTLFQSVAVIRLTNIYCLHREWRHFCSHTFISQDQLSSPQEEEGISQCNPRISGDRAYQNQTLGVERGRVSHCHNGMKCSELMVQYGGDLQRSAPLSAFSGSCHSVQDETHGATASCPGLSLQTLPQQLHVPENGPLILDHANNLQNPQELFIMGFLLYQQRQIEAQNDATLRAHNGRDNFAKT